MQHSSELEIINHLGLHARAAAKLVALANKYESRVWLGKGEQEVDAKSILSVLMLACGKGARVRLRVEGRDASEAHTALTQLIGGGFGET